MSDPADALARCVGDAAAFAADVWGRRPAHHRGGPGAGFDDLLTMEDVDRLIASSGLRTPSFRLVRDGTPLDPLAFTRRARTGGVWVSGLVDPVKVQRRFGEGATLVFQGMHRFWAPLARFCRDLEWALGHPTQVNAYVTPAGARGLAVHEDAHDVFVLQAFGSKHWNVWDTRAGVDRAKSGRAKPVITQTLEPGDTLYLPRLTPHAAEAQAQASGHLTIGIPAITWLVVLRRALAGMDQEERLDAPLPVGVHQDPAGLAAGIEDRLKEVRAWMERLDGEDLAAREIRRFLTTRPSLTDGGLRDLVALGSVGDATPLRRRPGSICVLETAEDALVVLLGDRELRMPARLRPAMEELSGLAHLTAGDLEEHLDEAGRLTLVRRLIREGLLEVVR